MIQVTTVNGRPATVAYLNDKFEPVEDRAAQLVKVTFTDAVGGMLFLTPGKQRAAEARLWEQTARDWDESQHPRDEHGRFSADGGGDGDTAKPAGEKPKAEQRREQNKNDPRYEQYHVVVERDLPHLNETNYAVVDDNTSRYNCIGYACGDNARWWWPGAGFWPSDVRSEGDIESFDDLFLNKLDAEETTDEATVEPTFTKIALFSKPSGLAGKRPTHMALQRPDGQWASKLGEYCLIDHDLHAMEGGAYGTIEKVYKVKTADWNELRMMR